MSIIIRSTVFHDTVISLTLFSKMFLQNETHSVTDTHILLSNANTILWQCKIIYEQTNLLSFSLKKYYPYNWILSDLG